MKIIDAVGGRKAVIEMTGLSRGRISQWVTDKAIPTPWLKFFEAKFPALDWDALRAPAEEEKIPTH
ncbi:hypothetical protein [Paucimonas lemoignei]|uniref:hypothetical protein n=1 Tax=Paucimonas lemoignei TaxID=29443 RepID=UPI0014053717|nr:hypothetical protein [Paucimonas lemoignei]